MRELRGVLGGLARCVRDFSGGVDAESGVRGQKAEDAAEDRLLTREELVVVLKVSLHTVDRMLAEQEIPCIKLRGRKVRFHMPEVIRVLVATAATRKRARGTDVA